MWKVSGMSVSDVWKSAMREKRKKKESSVKYNGLHVLAARAGDHKKTAYWNNALRYTTPVQTIRHLEPMPYCWCQSNVTDPMTLNFDLSTPKPYHFISSTSEDYSLYQVWTLWDHSFLSHDADKQRDRQKKHTTDSNIIPTPTVTMSAWIIRRQLQSSWTDVVSLVFCIPLAWQCAHSL